MANFSFGADPEFVLTKNDNLISAIGILPAKNKALNFQGNEFYYDNVLAEIALTPAKNRHELISNLRNVFQTFKDMLNPVKFETRAAQNYPDKQLQHPEAKIAGCNLEWNAYTLKYMMPPKDIISNTPFRTAGGHIHLGLECDIINLIKMMDLFIGVPSIYLDTDETSRERRKIYGHAGSHRKTDYGVEYRTLGNFWLSSPRHVTLIYNLCEFVVDFMEKDLHKKFWYVDESLLDDNPEMAHVCIGYDLDALLQCINNCDKKQGDKFMLFINNYLPDHLQEEIENLSNIPLPDLYEAWNLV